VARQESGFHPYAIRDETTKQSHYPTTSEEAATLASSLTKQGHLLGVGLMQLTPPANFGLSITEALDPCRNMKAGAELLASNYNLEWQALMRALSRYNSGSPTRAEAYAQRIVGEAKRQATMPVLAASPSGRKPALVQAPPAPAPAKPPPCVPSWDVWAICKPPTGALTLEAAISAPPP